MPGLCAVKVSFRTNLFTLYTSTRHELSDVTCEGECLILYRISCTSSSGNSKNSVQKNWHQHCVG